MVIANPSAGALGKRTDSLKSVPFNRAREAIAMAKIARWVHVGDLHVTDRDQQNYDDLVAIIGDISANMARHVDFVFLPGDIAENGTAAQYRLVREALAPLAGPVHIITGDHDMEPGHLGAFYAELGAPALPYAVTYAGHRCLFLDICGPGSGGPDFRLGAAQMAWLERELVDAAAHRQVGIVFMHSYPADLRDPQERARVIALFATHGVALVEMGHTHYNELANTGRTIFAATRSTGQIEEGPAGYSLAAIDDGVVSWCFKETARDCPLVLITSPADRRLVIDAGSPHQIVRGRCRVRALVFGASEIAACSCRIDDGDPVAMVWDEEDACWSTSIPAPDDAFRLTVEATDEIGRSDAETIEVATSVDETVTRHADGSDADAIGSWAEKGLLGTQLGPNRNGRKW